MQVPEALERLRRDKTPITFPAVARRADVSRTFLYDKDARKLMDAAVAQTA
ncbi:MAG: hypothetical protein JWN52_3141 [Actinomycetia bacterium]|nr:hypothetical protein [Actinomycetes bacterium]